MKYTKLAATVIAAAALLMGARANGAVYTVTGETLVLGPAAHNAVFNHDGADIQGGKIVFDYAGGANPTATIQGLLSDSYNGGLWDLGQFRNSTATTTGLTLGCFADASSHHVEVMATYPGDFNLDAVVDYTDQAIWFANAFTGTTWQQGDSNYDGIVNGLDLDLLRANFGSVPLASSNVPEPTTISVWLLLGVAGWLMLRHGKNPHGR
jgi:hypothetical protein